jgi:2-dehydro-3-deoxyphosphogluconate aldolase / (4S)-4-hydroxy-2-oxoglutarate aldolase
MTPDELRDELARERLVAIVRGPDPDRLLDCLRALVAGGLCLVEVSLTSVDAIEVIRQAHDELGDRLLLGAGTVLDGDQAVAVIEAGARYVVTPAYGPGVDLCLDRGVPVLVGAMTPTEIYTAHARGATAVKVFPASTAGGPAYIRALRDPFPDIPLVPVGGIHEAAVHNYVSAGAIAVGVGSPLLADAPEGGDLTALRVRAARFRQAVS